MTPTSPITDADRTAARVCLARMAERNKDGIVEGWLAAAGPDSLDRWPDIDRYLRSLLSGLVEVWSESNWTLAQTIIDGLAQRRAREKAHLEHGMLRALLAGRAAIRPLLPVYLVEQCEEILLDTLHECVFRFCESYQGVQLQSETERVHSRVIKSLVMALEARDPFTTGHSMTVALLAQRVAEQLDTDIDPQRAYLAGLLHDVGKVGIPDRILAKPAGLDDREWRIMRSHPVTGARILKPVRLYADVVDAVLTHHENFDGTGYPHGLVEEEILRSPASSEWPTPSMP